MLEERLIFEIGDSATTGVDFDSAPQVALRLGDLAGPHRSGCRTV